MSRRRTKRLTRASFPIGTKVRLKDPRVWAWSDGGVEDKEYEVMGWSSRLPNVIEVDTNNFAQNQWHVDNWVIVDPLTTEQILREYCID